MANLSGTEKQVTWAEGIRAERLGRWESVIADLDAVEYPRHQMLSGIMRQIVATLSGATEAATWIDGRDCPSTMLHIMGITRADAAARFGTDPRTFRDACVMMR